MVFRLLKYIYRGIKGQASLINHRFFKFLLPNVAFILSGRVNIGSYPSCQQRTILSGKGNIDIGKNCSFGYKLGGFYRGGAVELQPRYTNAKIILGKNIATNNNIFICAANYIEIGDDTLIGQYVTIMDHEAHGVRPDCRRKLGKIGKVTLGKNVWIGNNVTILKDSEIGDNSIVAAGAVVAGKFPGNIVIGGVPAKIIKSL